MPTSGDADPSRATSRQRRPAGRTPFESHTEQVRGQALRERPTDHLSPSLPVRSCPKSTGRPFGALRLLVCAPDGEEVDQPDRTQGDQQLRQHGHLPRGLRIAHGEDEDHDARRVLRDVRHRACGTVPRPGRRRSPYRAPGPSGYPDVRALDLSPPPAEAHPVPASLAPRIDLAAAVTLAGTSTTRGSCRDQPTIGACVSSGSSPKQPSGRPWSRCRGRTAQRGDGPARTPPSKDQPSRTSARPQHPRQCQA